jgi:hypothetical protein
MTVWRYKTFTYCYGFHYCFLFFFPFPQQYSNYVIACQRSLLCVQTAWMPIWTKTIIIITSIYPKHVQTTIHLYFIHRTNMYYMYILTVNLFTQFKEDIGCEKFVKNNLRIDKLKKKYILTFANNNVIFIWTRFLNYKTNRKRPTSRTWAFGAKQKIVASIVEVSCTFGAF